MSRWALHLERIGDEADSGYVKFLYRCTTGLIDQKANGCIMADEMGLGKTVGTAPFLLRICSLILTAAMYHSYVDVT